MYISLGKLIKLTVEEFLNASLYSQGTNIKFMLENKFTLNIML